MGDTYTGKVVKTTEFGAFVELKKGTDGLLHVSNVGPGRVAHIEDVIARGDVLDVIVQEVDKERGRIGLKLVAKHENGNLVQPEELIERAKDAPPRERRSARRAVTAIAAAAAAAAAVAVAAVETASRNERSGAPALVEARQQALLIAALRGVLAAAGCRRDHGAGRARRAGVRAGRASALRSCCSRSTAAARPARSTARFANPEPTPADARMQGALARARRGCLPEHDRAHRADGDRALAAAPARGLPGRDPGGPGGDVARGLRPADGCWSALGGRGS